MDEIDIERRFIIDQLGDVKYYFGSLPSRDNMTSYAQTLHIMTLDDENFCRTMCYYNSLVNGYKLIVRNYTDVTLSISRTEYNNMLTYSCLNVGLSFDLYSRTQNPDTNSLFIYGGMQKSRFCIDCYKWLKVNIKYMNLHQIYLTEELNDGF